MGVGVRIGFGIIISRSNTPASPGIREARPWDFVAVAQLECLQLLHVMPATAGHTRKQAHAAAFNDVGLKRAAYFVNGTPRCVGLA